MSFLQPLRISTRIPLRIGGFTISRPFQTTRYQSSTAASKYEYILTSTPRPGVGQITLNRPKALNALSTPVMKELNSALTVFSSTPEIGAVVLTGSEKAFAAGADIKEMKDITFSQAFGSDFIKLWSDLTSIPIPIIAAVNGYALGGGCELALMTDIIYCGPKATFGQPEIKLGIIPGAGGSQRLTRAIGKAKAMEIILTGKNFSAQEAEEWGVAARVFETPEKCVEGALDTAEIIAGYGKLAVKAAKEVVNQAYEGTLVEGVKYERRVFHALFASKDQKIGMEAFAKKEKPVWSNE
ncbi:ClpP/crotonase-like domain-containing protein [Trichophaea hybrida]|nr:ClpP/crotonase-like domain-containing protein [Trichophaea hybrida]